MEVATFMNHHTGPKFADLETILNFWFCLKEYFLSAFHTFSQQVHQNRTCFQNKIFIIYFGRHLLEDKGATYT